MDRTRERPPPGGLLGRPLGLSVVGRSGCASTGAPTVAEPGAAGPGPDDRLIRPRGRWSSEVFDVALEGGRHVVYAPLRRAAFVTTTAGRDALAHLAVSPEPAAIDPDLERFLQGMGLLDGGPEAPPDDLVTGTPVPTAATLFLTTACNLRCDYCYASAGDTVQEWMAWPVARRAVDTVVANAVTVGADQVSLALHGGGEPTLNWEVLTAAVDRLRSAAAAAGLRARVTLATNGVLPPVRADWLAANVDSASISCDGLPDVQDAHRPTVGGAGSSAPLIRTLTRFDAAGFRYNLRVTATRDQLARLPESVEFLATRFRPRRIQVEPAYRLGRWADAVSAETDEFVVAYREAELRARAAAVPLFYSAARLGLVSHHFCGVTRDTFAVSPSGGVSGCYEVFSESQPHGAEFFYGHSDPDGDGWTVDQGRLGDLRAHATGHHDFCSGCFAKWSCAGDCLHKARTESLDGTFRGSQRCHITRALTSDQIVRAVGEAGGLCWSAGPIPTHEEAS